MLIIFFVLLLGIFSIYQVLYGTKNNKVFYFMGCIWLLFPALRTEFVGTDTQNYLDFFLKPSLGYNGKTLSEVETGYVYWNYLVANIWKNIYFYLFCSAILSCSLKLYVFHKISNFPLFALFLYSILVTLEPLLFSEYGTIRQAISIGFYMMFLWQLQKENKNRIIICLCVAFALLSYLFHGSSILPLVVTLVLYFVPKKYELSKRNLIIILLISLFGGNVILLYGGELTSILSFLAIQQLNYLESMSDAVLFDGYGYYRNVLPLFCMALFILKYQQSTDDIITKSAIWGVILTNLLIQIPIGQRITYCFMPILCIAVSKVVNKKNILYILPIILFEFWRLYGYYISQTIGQQKFGDGNIIFPYTSILFN